MAQSQTGLSGIRIGVYLGVLTLGIWAALWVGPVTFYQTFQKPLEDGSRSGIVWAKAAVDTQGEAWRAFTWNDVELPVPGVDPDSVTEEHGRYVANFGETRVIYRPTPLGFLRGLLQEMRDSVGAHPVSDETTDQRILEAISTSTPEGYEFSWNAKRRGEYASRLLCKMLLWRDGEIARIEAARSDDATTTSVFVEYKGGKSVAIVVGKTGGWVIALPRPGPETWTVSAKSFVGVQPPYVAPIGEAPRS